MIDFTLLSDFLHSLNDHGLGFLFSDQIKYHDPGNIHRKLQESIKCFHQTKGIESIFHKLVSTDNVDIGLKIENIDKFLKKSGLPENTQAGINNLLDVILAKILSQMARDRNRTSHPQNLRHILSYFSEKKPDFLLIAESLLKIIPDQNHFAIEERGRASRTLVNNFKIETLYIYTSQDINLTEDQKQFVFLWLNAFQKVYRKIQEIITSTKDEKVQAAHIWFGKNLSQLKRDGDIPKADYLIPGFIKNFINCLLDGKDEELLRVGIKIVKHPDIAPVTNSVQLNFINYFKEGIYLGSTGHWNSQNQKPPSVICITNPHALGNCQGHMLRHVCLRVFLGTGEFYESPFILDSTQRFGQMDEDAGIDALIMRPGLFLLKIPPEILAQWKKVQKMQLKSKLDRIIEDKIEKERIQS